MPCLARHEGVDVFGGEQLLEADRRQLLTHRLDHQRAIGHGGSPLSRLRPGLAVSFALARRSNGGARSTPLYDSLPPQQWETDRTRQLGRPQVAKLAASATTRPPSESPAMHLFENLPGRSAAILAIGLLGCGSGPAAEERPYSAAAALDVPTERPLRAAFLIVDGVYNTELTAPYDVLEHTRLPRPTASASRSFTVSPDGETVTTAEGLRILPDYGFADAPRSTSWSCRAPRAAATGDLENAALVELGARHAASEARLHPVAVLGRFRPRPRRGSSTIDAATTFPSDYAALRRVASPRRSAGQRQLRPRRQGCSPRRAAPGASTRRMLPRRSSFTVRGGTRSRRRPADSWPPAARAAATPSSAIPGWRGCAPPRSRSSA